MPGLWCLVVYSISLDTLFLYVIPFIKSTSILLNLPHRFYHSISCDNLLNPLTSLSAMKMHMSVQPSPGAWIVTKGNIWNENWLFLHCHHGLLIVPHQEWGVHELFSAHVVDLAELISCRPCAFCHPCDLMCTLSFRKHCMTAEVFCPWLFITLLIFLLQYSGNVRSKNLWYKCPL